MNDFALGIAVNLASAVLVFVIVWGFLFLSRRAQLVDFFHVRRHGITLYTSTLNVKRFGSTDAQGQPRSFQGPALPIGEALVIADYERTLSSYAFGGLAIMRWLRFVDVDVSVDPSPGTSAAVERSRTLLSLGSPGYNTASELIEAEFTPLGWFANPSEIAVLDGPPTDSLTGMLLRAVHPTTGQVGFYAAGPSEVATVTAARYLLSNWRTLARQYPSTRPFCIVVQADFSGGATVLHQTPAPRSTPWQWLTGQRTRR